MVKNFVDIKGLENYFFTCECKGNYNGFKHIVTMYNNNNVYFEHKTSVQYYNRTWERYEFETALNKCINEVTSELIEQIKNNIKRQYNIKRFTKKYDAILNDRLNDCKLFNDYVKIKNEINK